MVELPMLNGGRTENRWQPMSQLTWCAPSSRSTSFMAAKIGRSGQPVQNDGGRPCTFSPSILSAACRRRSRCWARTCTAQDRVDRLLDEIGLTFLDDQD